MSLLPKTHPGMSGRVHNRRRGTHRGSPMPSSVICISRTAFAGGETVGYLVAERLGKRYVDDEIIRLAAEKAKVEPELVERTEHRVRLLQRLIDAMGGPISWAPPPEGYYPTSRNLLSRPTCEALPPLIRAPIP